MARFSDIVGNDGIKNNIKSAVSTGNVNHAYIISGPFGSGKKMIADIFAKALCCEGENPPCESCQSCHMADSGNNPDIIYPKPAKTKTLGVDDIREQVIKPSNIKPYMFKYKVFIIDDADKMTVEAQNAFLKTLEEPSGFSVFILLAEDTDNFLQTILSRCVLLRTTPVETEKIKNILLSRGVGESAAEVAAEYARGSVGEALLLAEDEDFIAMREDVIGILSTLYDKGSAEAVLYGEYFKKTYKDDKRLIDTVYMWYRDVLAAKTTKDEKYIIQKDKKDLIFSSAAKESVEDIVKKAEAAKKALIEIKRNANFQLALEVMLMNIKEN